MVTLSVRPAPGQPDPPMAPKLRAHRGRAVRATPKQPADPAELVEASRHLLRSVEGMCPRLRILLAAIDHETRRQADAQADTAELANSIAGHPPKGSPHDGKPVIR